jgi:hypothetical protein
MYWDPNTLYKVLDRPVGSVDSIVLADGRARVCGRIDDEPLIANSLTEVIVLDGSDRFVTAGIVHGNSWDISVEPALLGQDNSARVFRCFAGSKTHRFIFPIQSDELTDQRYSDFARAHLPVDSRDVPSIKDELRSLVASAVKVPYVARSIHDAIKTGNNYQTLALAGDRIVKGDRGSRGSILRTVRFSGKTVVDIGANTGENARVARMLGASLVDGYEYDPFFVEVGRAVNALAGTTRVSLFQGDCTKPELFDGMKCDIIIALAVWVYLEETIRLLPGVAPLMIFETHTLDHGMDFYYRRVLPHFPHAACLGLTDVGPDPNLSRAMIIFATDRAQLDAAVARKFLRVEPYFRNKFLERCSNLTPDQAWSLAAECFSRASKITAYTEADHAYGRTGYFELLLAGLHQFSRDRNTISEDNVFLLFFVEGVRRGILDPSQSYILTNEKWLKRKLANKFEDMIQIITGFPDHVPPIRLLRRSGGALKFRSVDGQDYVCDNIDGHHRFFTCQLMGVDKIHFTSE